MKIITKKKEKKILEQECWNLDYELVKWLNEHFKVYLEDASKIIKLESHEFKVKNKKYNLKTALERLIELTDYLMDDDIYFSFDKETVEKVKSSKNEMYDILKEIHFCLWW